MLRLKERRNVVLNRRFPVVWEVFPFLLLAELSGYAQTFTVKGKATASILPARFASVTFVDENDTARRFATLTDTLRNNRIDSIPSVRTRDNVGKHLMRE